VLLLNVPPSLAAVWGASDLKNVAMERVIATAENSSGNHF